MLKFMNDEVTPPSGPKTRMPNVSKRAWYFHVPGAGNHRQRGADSVVEDVAGAVMAPGGLHETDAVFKA
jgi:hypothetical protein